MLEKLLSFPLTLQFFLNFHFDNLTGSLFSISKESCFYLYEYLDMHLNVHADVFDNMDTIL